MRESSDEFHTDKNCRTGQGLAMNLDFVRCDRSLFIAHRLNPGYREPPIAQVGERALQGIVQVVLQRWRLFRRSQYACIHAILLAVTVIRD